MYMLKTCHRGSRSSLQSNTAKNEKQVTSRVSSPDIRSFALTNKPENDLGAFQELLAMHFCMTGKSFARIEKPHLLAAIQKLSPDVTLPSRKDLTGKYLQTCYRKVKVKVDAWLSWNSFNCLK
jgi:hypothetical protein